MEDVPLSLDSALKVYGPYPLHKTVLLGHKLNLQFLLECGLSPNQTNYDCITPLHEACNGNRVECAEILINYGAKVNATSVDGGTPLCDACAAGNVSCVELLMRKGANVNPPLTLSTPLHEASFRGSLSNQFSLNMGSMDCINLLIQAGAQLNANDCHFGTPLHAATVSNHPECVRLLLQAGALVNATKTHETPLHIAARENFVEVAQILVEYGANVYASNNQNKLPIDLLRDPEGILYHLLSYHAGHPLSLKDICRRKVRASLGSRRLHYLADLDIPLSLVYYLMHKDFQSSF